MAAKMYDPDLRYQGTDTVSNMQVTRWSKSHGWGNLEVALAVFAGCEVMEEKRVSFDIGQGLSFYRFRITKYVPGEPDDRTFHLPYGYRVQPHPDLQ
jgi:hypothetical protein